MKTLETRTISTLALAENEEAALATLLHPMYLSLIMGLTVFGGGAIMTISSLSGAIPATLASSVFGWAGVWLGGVIGFASLLGLVFAKPVVLRITMYYREKNALAARLKLSNTETLND